MFQTHAVTMAISRFSSLISLVVITTTMIFSPRPSSSRLESTPTFIRTNCNMTSYPDLCESSLCKYSSDLNGSSLQLAQLATNVSLSNLQSTATTTASQYKNTIKYGGNSSSSSSAIKALRDCVALLNDAVDNTQYSLSELKKLNLSGGSRESLWRLANIETYMSAALTKEDTCTDGLKEMGAQGNLVSARVGRAKQYSSNALALVNRLWYGYY